MCKKLHKTFRTTGFLHSSWLETIPLWFVVSFVVGCFLKRKHSLRGCGHFGKQHLPLIFPHWQKMLDLITNTSSTKKSRCISGIHFLCFMPPFIRWLICLWSESFEEQMWEIISRRKDQFLRRKDQFHKKAHCNFFSKLKETAHVGQRESHMCGILFLLISMCGIEWYFLRKNKVTVARTCTSP